jgi:4-oxalocrotonate tautomerase family enzyme
MPPISIHGPALLLEKKREPVQKMTEVTSEIYQIPREKFIIHIQEFSKENFGSGGLLLIDRKGSYKMLWTCDPNRRTR